MADTTTTIARFPTVDSEYPAARALRVLAYVLAGHGTAALDTADLELADHFFPIATSAHDILPIAVDRLSDARRLVLQALGWRRDDDQPAAGVQPAGADRVVPGGRLAPLQPPRPTVPPAGQAIDVRPASQPARPARPAPAQIDF